MSAPGILTSTVSLAGPSSSSGGSHKAKSRGPQCGRFATHVPRCGVQTDRKVGQTLGSRGAGVAVSRCRNGRGYAANRRSTVQVRSSTSTAVTSKVTPQKLSDVSEEKLTEYMQEISEFLKVDLDHLFDDQGIDATLYDKKVFFQDPITNYDGIEGYLFNIQFLRRVFEPTFVLHNVRRTGPYELTTRWTMGMKLGWFPLKQFWMPSFMFTGTSIMGINPETGKFNSHVDTWDSIQNQAFLSIEAVQDLVKQMFEIYWTPELETPEYAVMKRYATYEVREYSPFVVAEAEVAGATQSAGVFQALANYIFGANASSTKMAMTTPVFTTEGAGGSTMQFVVPGPAAPEAPAPRDPAVRVREEPGGFYAVVKFSGVATSTSAAKAAEDLRAQLLADNLVPEPGYTLARYNDPSTPSFFRRNEVLIHVPTFKLLDDAEP
uniref:SOUL heme-binding protein n=1 Tax=Pyramimonas obovata TaxID=1411642 RepID=A0A7S0WVG3_9CHLO|mmetsp:Transcript_4796/g.9787  ORF Transcript_4796/g.9787 Transcript_4796/m.9787 type:complete len:435 (+) Transcript_4796:153-1457(+)|eukprot:CAMPEP_0118923266 /NCGR_PEP_ID=MMETSP1169-20130426/1861_1 /TAXON_ID=36882 /ORGANISM="Pyramimonas obovata, Strain CCMP722" /LENGTH=434 /DNA_ID=CAMNT_0006864233 /DNA_START=110 /DNA_END=1414 /DNA_ORIENTATION=-